MKKKKIQLSDSKIIIAGILIAIILPSIFLLSDAFSGQKINAENASQYGSFIGGYIGSILSFLSIIFLILTLRHQRKSSFDEKFENNFFELIKIHRDNLKEIGGRRQFVLLIREFRYILDKTKQIFLGTDTSNVQIFGISYSILFYGTGPNSTRELRTSIKKCDNFFIDRVIKEFDNIKYKKEVMKELNLKYIPFEGNQSRLGHYYRHLYQTVCYVDNQSGLSNKEKYDYIKILRAQLSNHEQAVLFLNSLSSMGKNWDIKGLLLKYRLIKNLPEDFFNKDSEINIKEIYPNLTFQWEEND